MKKSFFLFLASFCFALPAFAQNTTQTSQTVKTIDTPAQVNVTINNTTTAQGNTQTTKIENTPAQPATITATASTTNPGAGQNVSAGSSSLYGNYASSPYHSNVQVEMLRNTIWGSLVPRKRLYDDPATGNSSTRYIGSSSTSSSSKYTGRKSSKKKSGNKQAANKQKTNAGGGTPAAGTQTAAGQAINSLAAGSQNALINLPSGQTVTIVRKDGLLCVPIEQIEQITGQKFVPDTANSSVFYVPTSPSPATGANSGNSANPAFGTNPAQPATGVTGAGQTPAANSSFGANPAPGASSAIGAGSAAAPANTGNPATPAASAFGTNPTAGVSPASPAAGASPAQSVAPASGSANTPERDIFAIPANPFGTVNSSIPANSSFAGGTRNAGQNPAGTASGQSSPSQNPLGQRSLGDNAPSQNPLSQNLSGNNSIQQNSLPSPVPAGANGTSAISGTPAASVPSGTSGRDISVTAGNSGTPNS